MAIRNTRELFLYELGVMRDAERAGERLLDFLARRVTNSDLVQILRKQQQDCQQQLSDIGSCLRAFGASPVETPSETVDGILRRFEGFIRLQPSPEMLDQFAVDTAIRFNHAAIAGYKTLLDWAILMGETECVRHLHTNLLRKQENASTLEWFSHELGVRLLAPV